MPEQDENVATQEGRTVLFVSHNMDAVRLLCTRCLLLTDGQLAQDGKPGKVIEDYHASLKTKRAGLKEVKALSESKPMAVTRFEVQGETPDAIVQSGKRCLFLITARASRRLANLRVAIGVDDRHGRRLFTLDTTKYNQSFPAVPGENIFACEIEALP